MTRMKLDTKKTQRPERRAESASPTTARGERTAQEARQLLTAEETGLADLTAFGRAEGTRPAQPLLEHRHRGKQEFVVCTAGMQMNTVSGVDYTVYAGEVLVIRADEPHVCPESQPAPGTVYWFQIDMTFHTGFMGLSGRDGGLLHAALAELEARKAALPAWALEQLEQAFRLLAEGDDRAKLSGRVLFLSVLTAILDAPVLNAALTPDIDRAKQYILLHIREPIDTDELLLSSGLTLVDFRRKFAAQIGLPPREYINYLKVERAKADVADPRRSVTDIAYRYHFPTASVFRAQFKKATGMSVTQYRKKNRY